MYKQRAFGLFVLCLCAFSKSEASHVYGADLFYTHLHDSTYKVSLAVYGDCGGAVFPSLRNSMAGIIVMQGTDEVRRINLPLEDSGLEVTPICSRLKGQSNCQMPNGPIPGIKRYIFSVEYKVPYRAKDWVFYFDGNLGSSLAGRSSNLTNFDNAFDAGVLTLSATLDNLSKSENSSPNYTTIPTPFYCIGNQQFNPGAVDPDGDSLSFELVPAMNGKKFVRYDTGYSGSHPLSTAPGQFSFDSLTGQLSFAPDRIQRSLAVIKVTEYREGVIVGTSLREMTFIVITNCNSNPVSSRLDTAIANRMGGVPEASTFFACASIDSVHFHIIPAQPVPDTITAEVNGLPKGATYTITGNETPNPVINIGWNAQNIPPGSYHFFVSFTDNDCPLNSKQVQAYTIRLTAQPVASISGPDSLCHNQMGIFQFNGQAGTGPQVKFSWDWDHPVFSLGQDTAPWQIIWSNEREKHIFLEIEENHCRSNRFEKTVWLKPIPYAYFELPAEICEHDSIQVQFGKEIDGWTYQWNFGGAELSSGKEQGFFTLRWQEAGKKTVRLNTVLNGCMDSSQHEIIVRPAPNVHILNTPGPVCLGDKIFLRATGGNRFVWLPSDSMLYTPAGELYAQILKPTTYRVLVENEYGCLDSAAIRYSEVEPCCQFSYPNAFSPNNDGRNDRFRIITQGSHLRYELSIYNQWGQRVYYGLDAEEGWDGSFRGKACEPGAYYYYLNATCYTGQHETRKGGLMLVR